MEWSSWLNEFVIRFVVLIGIITVNRVYQEFMSNRLSVYNMWDISIVCFLHTVTQIADKLLEDLTNTRESPSSIGISAPSASITTEEAWIIVIKILGLATMALVAGNLINKFKEEQDEKAIKTLEELDERAIKTLEEPSDEKQEKSYYKTLVEVAKRLLSMNIWRKDKIKNKEIKSFIALLKNIYGSDIKIDISSFLLEGRERNWAIFWTISVITSTILISSIPIKWPF